MPNTPTNHEITCSFCGKPAGDARRIIAGISAYICDECVEMCYDLIAGDAEQVQGLFLIMLHAPPPSVL